MRPAENRPLRKRRSSEGYVFSAFFIISFSVLFLSTRSFIVDFRDLGLSVYSGLRGGVHGALTFVSRTVLSVSELASLRKDYSELLARMERYELLERTAADINTENIRLREQLGFSQNMQFTHIPAQIIGRDPDNLYSSYVINKGIRDGIARDMPVIAYQNGVQGLVGKVVQVGRLESLVMPLYDSNSFVSARLSESRYEGIVSGLGNPDSSLIMRYVKKRAREEIQIGDMVISSGMGGVFPKGISIARVGKIIFQEYETSLDLELESMIDFSRLEYVFAISGQKEISSND
jgi:rod shape-determining protein MreC